LRNSRRVVGPKATSSPGDWGSPALTDHYRILR
jgi:hypothetical protein